MNILLIPSLPPPRLLITSEITFELVVNDGIVDSQPDTVDIVIEPSSVTRFVSNTNNAPVVKDLSVKTNKSQSLNIILPASDSDVDDELKLQIVSQPLHGNLGLISHTESKVTYTPLQGFLVMIALPIMQMMAKLIVMIQRL